MRSFRLVVVLSLLVALLVTLGGEGRLEQSKDQVTKLQSPAEQKGRSLFSNFEFENFDEQLPLAAKILHRPLKDRLAHLDLLLNDDSMDHVGQASTLETIEKVGFKHEIFNITSHDGYITQLIRLVNPRVVRDQLKRGPVVLYGGQGVSPSIFTISINDMPITPHQGGDQSYTLPPSRSLAFFLSNCGYDVWLVPARGVDHANRGRVESKISAVSEINGLFDSISSNESLAAKVSHFTKRSFEPFNYWTFSSDDIIKNEFQAQLDMVMKVSDCKKISLITYSNGGFIALAFLASNPDFGKQHVDLLVALAPAIFIDRFNLKLALTGIYSHLTPDMFPVAPEPLDAFSRIGLVQMCKIKTVRYTICKLLLNSIYGPSDDHETFIGAHLLDSIGRPTSAKTLRQLAQVSISRRMKEYDYTLLGNLLTYKSISPPEYELSKVKVPKIHIFAGERDTIADKGGLSYLEHQLSSSRVFREQIPGYNHLDIVTARDVGETVNTHILYLLEEIKAEEIAGVATDREEHEFSAARALGLRRNGVVVKESTVNSSKSVPE